MKWPWIVAVGAVVAACSSNRTGVQDPVGVAEPQPVVEPEPEAEPPTPAARPKPPPPPSPPEEDEPPPLVDYPDDVTRDTARQGTAVGRPRGRLGPPKEPARMHGSVLDCPFPAEADEDEALVILLVTVKDDGTVDRVRVTRDPGHGFGQAALACIFEHRFYPAEDAQGRPVPSLVPVRVHFRR